jgi:anti-sigma factor RsiW
MPTQPFDNSIFEIITAYVDGEATSDEIAFIESKAVTDRRIVDAIQREKALKKTLQSRLVREKAPERLQLRCLQLISEMREKGKSENTTKQTAQTVPMGNFMRWAAAAIVVLTLGTWVYQYTSESTIEFAVEDHAYRHFATFTSDLAYLPIDNHSTTAAEEYLSAHFGMNMTIPNLDGANFEGVVLSEFVPGYETPMLTYSALGPDDIIMIFAFEVSEMEGTVHLTRDQTAVETCVKHDDIHIKDVDGKHVVSWKWGETWYTAISHHDGEAIAAMLPINR